MSPEQGDQPLNAAEKRVSDLLEPLRAESPRAPAELTDEVIRTLRWQRTARGTLVLLGGVVAAATAATEVLLGVKRSNQPRERR